MAKCEFRKSDGNRCKAAALTGDNYCFTHSPKVAAERHEARVKGGHGKAGIPAPQTFGKYVE